MPTYWDDFLTRYDISNLPMNETLRLFYLFCEHDYNFEIELKNAQQKAIEASNFMLDIGDKMDIPVWMIIRDNIQELFNECCFKLEIDEAKARVIFKEAIDNLNRIKTALVEAQKTAHNTTSAMPKPCCHVCGSNNVQLAIAAVCNNCKEDIDVTHEYIIFSKASA